MRKMRRTEKRRSRGAHTGKEQSEGAGQATQQEKTLVVIRWETAGRRTTGEKGTGTEMATEEGNEERGERVGRVPLCLQQPHHPPPPTLPTSCLQRSPSPRSASLGLELCRKNRRRSDLLKQGAGQEHTPPLTMDRVSPPLIPPGKTWRSQMRRRRRTRPSQR